MADEKLNTGPAENISPEAAEPIATPEQAVASEPQQEQTGPAICNAKFAEKGLDVRIDHRSYERQGIELLPTVHEGATVRAMEKKGIRTEKGEFNRWIRATNAVIRDIKKKIALLFDWIAVLDGAS